MRLIFPLTILIALARLAAADDLSFNRDIKPILSQNCFQCHGPDDQHRAAGLRLDSAASAAAPAESGTIAVVAGNPDQSALIARVTATDPELRMPPPASEKHLTPDQIEMLRRWIQQGAPYEQHWAFEPPVRHEVPREVSGLSGGNPVDAFIQQRLQRERLAPSPEADRETLIRRASLDLTGLPPTIDEVDQFLNDQSPDAWEHLLDRLLASPHYGERMAVSWLDHARFADSNGFQTDSSREMWPWRDWVIESFNKNQPFDQFTIEQLAGDLLPSPTQNQMIATGFNRNHRLNGEGGRIEQEWFIETVIDRVETTGLTWLGLTLNCCRCHDHKYDPISQREFYQLFAYFNSVEESGVLAPSGNRGENTPPLLKIVSPEAEARRADLDRKLAAADARRQELASGISDIVAAWEAESRKQAAERLWVHAEPTAVKSMKGANFVRQSDGSWLATGPNPANDAYQIEIPLTLPRLTGILLEVFPDKDLPAGSLGRGSNGNFVLTGFSAAITQENGAIQPVELSAASADYEQPNYTAAKIQLGLQSEDKRSRVSGGWAIDGNDPAKKVPRRVYFLLAAPVIVAPGSGLVVAMTHDSQFADHNVGRFRISLSSLNPERLGFGSGSLPGEIQQILDVPRFQRSTPQSDLLRKYVRENTANPLREADRQVAAVEKEIREHEDSLPVTMIMKEGPQRDAFMLTRGEYDRPTDKVDRAVPGFLPALPPGAPNNRLGLAHWIASPANPLTARVWVNREWERFFGTGIVRTTENFGSQSEYPSHPELLDWLATEFMNPTVLPAVNGVPAQPWDRKALQKLILMSHTYRQTTRVGSESLRLDPENRLLSRGPRFRLTAEVIRDQVLAVSGLLSPKIGGPSVRPYMPEGVWDETSKYGDLRGYRHEKGEGLYRRTMYTIWKRTAAPPTLLLFDATNREVCTIKRSRTNTPLQALALLNEVTFVEAAKSLAIRLLKEGEIDPRERLVRAFRIVTGRTPNPSELHVLQTGLENDIRTFAESPDLATRLLKVGELPVPEDLHAPELAAWTVTANVLLNLDEVITRE